MREVHELKTESQQFLFGGFRCFFPLAQDTFQNFSVPKQGIINASYIADVGIFRFSGIVEIVSTGVVAKLFITPSP
jgi:hypothetical protein